jgi:hypothetical protein
VPSILPVPLIPFFTQSSARDFDDSDDYFDFDTPFCSTVFTHFLLFQGIPQAKNQTGRVAEDNYVDVWYEFERMDWDFSASGTRTWLGVIQRKLRIWFACPFALFSS